MPPEVLKVRIIYTLYSDESYELQNLAQSSKLTLSFENYFFHCKTYKKN